MSKDKALDIVLSEFLELAKVPRPSHHEERVSEYLFQWAKNHGLAVEKDNMNEIDHRRGYRQGRYVQPGQAGCPQDQRIRREARVCCWLWTWEIPMWSWD